jgi:hypothetical protein
MTKLTDLTKELTSAPAQDDLMHIVDKSDTSESPDGSSKKITIENLHREIVSKNITIKEFVKFDTAYATPLSEGQAAWDQISGTLRIGMPGGSVELQVGQEGHLSDRPKNDEGVQINDGQVVYLSGAAGAVPFVKLANAANYDTACKTIAVATENIPNNQRGYYTTRGVVRNIDTSAFNDGDELWLAATPGGLTTTRPTAPNCSVRMGYVLRSNANEGSILVAIEIERDLVVNDIKKEPTGFTSPKNVGISYNSSARTVTLTGTVNGYYKGRPNPDLVSSWVSPPHPNTLDKQYFLIYNGSSFNWVDLSAEIIDFADLLIAFANYGTNDKWALRECHGIMPWQSHEESHDTIGTYKVKGGDIGSIVEGSTLVANRRPSIAETTIKDEDLETVNPELIAGGNYTQFFLSGSNTVNFNKIATDIVPLLGNQPYWNEFTGGSWQQTLMLNNTFMSVFLFNIPVTSDAESQAYRYVFLQGQSNTATEAQQVGIDLNSLNLGNLSNLTPEKVFVTQFIIHYIGGNWNVSQVRELKGTNRSQTSSVTGNFLSVVTSDSSLNGDGTVSNPLTVVGQPHLNPIIGLLDLTTSEPASPNIGDGYINLVTGLSSVTGQSVTAEYVYYWNGSSWNENIPSGGDRVWSTSDTQYFIYNGSSWQYAGDTLITRSGLTSVKNVVEGDNLAWTSYVTNDFTIRDANNNTVQVPVDLIHTVTNTAAIGIGVGQGFWCENASNTTVKIGSLEYAMSNVTAGTEESYADVKVLSAGSLVKSIRFDKGGVREKLGHTGADASFSQGANYEVFTDADAYALYAQYNYQHDGIYQTYDAYNDGAGYKSSDVGSNVLISKNSDKFEIYGATGVTVGNSIAWGTPAFSMRMTAANVIEMPRIGATTGVTDNYMTFSQTSVSENHWLRYRSGGSPRTYNGVIISNFDTHNYFMTTDNSGFFLINYNSSVTFSGSSNVLKIGSGNIFFPNAFGDTVSGGTTLYMKSDGQIGTSTSLRTAKTNIKKLTIDDAKWLLDLPSYKFNYKKTNKEGECIDEAESWVEYGYMLEDMQEHNKDLVAYKRKKGKFVDEKITVEKKDKDGNVVTKLVKKEFSIEKVDKKTNKKIIEKVMREVAVPDTEIKTVKKEVFPIDKKTGKEVIEDDLSKPCAVRKENVVPHLVVLVQDLYTQIDELKKEIKELKNA